MSRPAPVWLLCVGILLIPRLAPGTVAAQRGRLPPPAACADPVVGRWKSHAFNETAAHWNQFTLDIRRADDGSLEGEIVNHSWEGPASEEWPGTCTGGLRFVVSMGARGTLEGDLVSFYGVGDWKLDELLCGDSNFGYNLDRFTGRIDAELQEFQSVNNDGGLAINVPTVFRRVSCGGGPPDPVASAPPPYFPPVTRGCW